MRNVLFKTSAVIAALAFTQGCGGSDGDVSSGGGGGGGTITSPCDEPPVVTPAAPNLSAVAPPAIATQAAFTNLSFTSPVLLLRAPADPGTNSLWYVVEQAGTVRFFDATDPLVNSSTVFIDINLIVTLGFESGLLGMAFHPDWPNTPEVFLSYTGDDGGGGLMSFVSRFTSNNGGTTLDPTSEEVLLSVPQPFPNHNGGNIAFGPDGFLYIGFGDGGSANDPQDNAQDATNWLGSMLRIDVDGGTPYAIPPGNPFSRCAVCVQGSGALACPEIYAWGLRNPWRWTFDSVTDQLWVGDVGQGAIEEVDVLVGGGNFGWREFEGTMCNMSIANNMCSLQAIDPVTEYPHGAGLGRGNSITGGYVYRGTVINGLQGIYVYADFIFGKVFQAWDDGTGSIVFTEALDTDFGISSFGEDNDGELFLLDYNSGAIHQVVAGP